MSGVNPLQEFPRARQMAYRVIWVLTAIVAGVQVFFAAMPDLTVPPWMAGVSAVLLYASGLTNFTADQNVYAARHGAGDLGEGGG